MRDTLVIRRRLQAAMAVCLPLGSGLVACDAGDETPTASASGTHKAEGSADEAESSGRNGPNAPHEGDQGSGEGDAQPQVIRQKATRVDPDNPPPPSYNPNMPKPGDFIYFGPARDPWAEHDEEEGCPSGDWCAADADARLFMVEHVPDQMECAARIVANADVNADGKVDTKDPKWKGFSFHPMMQGSLDPQATTDARTKKGHEKDCCYHWFEYCSGRPLFDAEEDLVVAELRPGSGWQGPLPSSHESDPAEDDLELRRSLAEAWLEDAKMEHASVAAFARTTLELMAMGAPPHLLAECQHAALDEIRHARACFALATHYSGTSLEPARLDTTRVTPRPSDWARLAIDTFVEGCVGETVAALVATRSLRTCRSPHARETLEMIAHDETAHAALAWKTLGWIMSSATDRNAVVAALRNAARTLRPTAEFRTPTRSGADRKRIDLLAEHGRLDPGAIEATRRDAWSEIILPSLDELSSAAAPACRV